MESSEFQSFSDSPPDFGGKSLKLRHSDDSTREKVTLKTPNNNNNNNNINKNNTVPPKPPTHLHPKTRKSLTAAYTPYQPLHPKRLGTLSSITAYTTHAHIQYLSPVFGMVSRRIVWLDCWLAGWLAGCLAIEERSRKETVVRLGGRLVGGLVGRLIELKRCGDI